MGIKKYTKWLFTRWYLYVLIVFHLVVINGWVNVYLGLEPQQFDPYIFVGSLAGAIFLYGVIITVIKKLFSFLFTSRDTPDSKR